MAIYIGHVSAYAIAKANGYEGTEEEFGAMLGQISITLGDLTNLRAVATTRAAGSQATASYADGVLTLGIPRGDKGETGNGIQSVAKTGTSGTNPVVDTYTITYTNGQTTTFQITNGIKGDTGATPELTIGTVTTGEVGSDAAATITGTPEHPVLGLTLPRGATGDVTNLAGTFSSASAYSAGDYVIYNDLLYVFNADHAAGSWTGTDATQVKVGTELSALKEDINDIDEVLNGEIIPVALSRFDSKLINSSGELMDGNNYSIFRFPMLDGVTYKITGKNNEVLRLGADNSDSTSWRMLPFVKTSADSSYLEYTNTDGFTYGFIFGVTPSYTSASFSVSYRGADSALNDLRKKVSLPTANDAIELVRKGAKSVTYGSVEYDDDFTLSTGYAQTFLNLYSLSSNGAFDYANNLNSAEENTFEDYDAIKIDVDVTISRSTFQQFAVGLKAPNSTTTVKTFFNVSGSALDANNRFRFSKIIRLDIGTKFSIPFLYLQDDSASGSNRTAVTGSISVTKYKQSTAELIAYNLPYNVIPQMDGDIDYIIHGNARSVGKLKKLGNMIVDSNNVPVELRGVGLHAICQYSNLHTWETFKCLRYMGCNLVRISVYLEDFQFSKSDGEIYYGYLSHPNENKAEIEKIIKNCVDLGMYVLLDWHVMDDQSLVVGTHYSGLDVLHQNEAEDFFEYYSSKYANCPNVLYEFANEPYSLTPAQMMPFIQSIRSIVTSNVVNPIMVTGMGQPISGDYSSYLRCKALYEEMASNGITDVFTSPHVYGSILGQMQNLMSEEIPFIMTEWGNSSYTGDGAGNDADALAQINWMHTNAIGHSIWKFTDQDMTSCLLKNYGFINSQRYFFGFNWNDLSHNGVLLLGRYYDYIRDEWIERTAIE